MSLNTESLFKRTIFAIGVGNALEWYDFAIFGALADVFGEHFFPAESKGAELMAAFSVYCSAFFMRPLGGIFFGYIGDTYGRKKALEISILLMILSSFMIGILPTYEMIGYWATGMIVILRMMQGVAVGGEMVGAYIYTVEACTDTWVAYWSGICKSTGQLGTVLGMGFVALLREVLTFEQFYNWGWRVPFLASIVIGCIGAYLRTFMRESSAFLRSRKTEEHTGAVGSSSTEIVWKSLKHHWPEIICVSFIVSFWATGFYTCFIWMAYYTTDLMSTGAVPHAWLINTTMMGIFVFMIPCAGYAADKVCINIYGGNTTSYRKSMVFAATQVVVTACPVFYFVNKKMVFFVCVGYFAISQGLALYASCLPVVIVKHFSVKYRYTSIGIAYNVANAIFAGTAPLIQTTIILHDRSSYWVVNTVVLPALLLIVVGCIAIVFLIWGIDFCQFLRQRHSMENWSGMEGEELNRSICSVDISTSAASVLDTSITPMIK